MVSISSMTLLSSKGFCQTVSGRVSDSLGMVIAARITLFNSDTTYFRETRSDSTGIFSIEKIPAGSYRIGGSYPAREYQETAVSASEADAQIDFFLSPEVQPGSWQTLGIFREDTFGGTDSGVLLPDGRIIYCHDTIDPVILDPVSNKVAFPPKSPKIQGCSAVGLLQDGRVIFVGGADRQVYGPGTRQVKAFDPVRSKWEVLPDLTTERWYPSMVQLPDGEWLAVGGGGVDNPIRVNTSEIFDPSTRAWRAVGDIAIGNEVSPILLLLTGEVLMTHRPPQIYNPDTGQWRLAADFLQGNRMSNGDHSDHEVVLMPDGRAVAIGYRSFSQSPGNLVEVYDPAKDSWSVGSNFPPVRSRASIVLLPDRKILVMGGFKEERNDPTPINHWGYMDLTDLYDPQKDSWRRLQKMSIAREYHTLPILVPDGRVIVIGGEGRPGIEPDRNVIEAFGPPYLFRGVRPEIKDLSRTKVERGGRLYFRVEKTDAPTNIILMGTAATTHFMDSGNSRFLDLEFTRIGRQIEARIPDDSVKAPLGYYILFAMVDDIPSIGRIIKIDPPESVGELAPDNKMDFDKDGSVAFSDFFLFAKAFGRREGEPDYDPRFDLDLNGSVGLSDFFLFAEAFGN